MDWSSGESEPELLVEDDTASELADPLESINYEDEDIPGLSFDSMYHPSIKDFIGRFLQFDHQI